MPARYNAPTVPRGLLSPTGGFQDQYTNVHNRYNPNNYMEAYITDDGRLAYRLPNGMPVQSVFVPSAFINTEIGKDNKEDTPTPTDTPDDTTNGREKILEETGGQEDYDPNDTYDVDFTDSKGNTISNFEDVTWDAVKEFGLNTMAGISAVANPALSSLALGLNVAQNLPFDPTSDKAAKNAYDTIRQDWAGLSDSARDIGISENYSAKDLEHTPSLDEIDPPTTPEPGLIDYLDTSGSGTGSGQDFDVDISNAEYEDMMDFDFDFF